MRDTWSLAVAMLAVWINCLIGHQSEPTWTDLWVILAVWFAIDLVSLVYRALRA